MKALTVYEPWASLISLGEKKIETRSWYTKYRGPIAIHAAATRKPEYVNLAWEEPFFTALASPMEDAPGKVGIRYHLGCILAIANLVNCIPITPEFCASLSDKERAFGDYTFGRFAWVLEDIRRLAEPITARGRQRIWNWDATEHLVWFDPYVVGDDRIWTPQGILTGQVVPEGTEDAVQGLQIMGVVV